MKPIDGEELMDRVDFILSRVKTPEVVNVFQQLKSYLENTPTLTLDDLRPKGRWVIRGGRRYCSHCGERACVTRDREDFWYTTGTKFCSECGADMRGGDTR